MGGGDGMSLKRNVNVITLPGTAEADLAAIKAKIDTIQADTETWP